MLLLTSSPAPIVPGMDDKLLQKATCKFCGNTATAEIERSSVKTLGKKFELKLNDESEWRERVVLKVSSKSADVGMQSSLSDIV